MDLQQYQQERKQGINAQLRHYLTQNSPSHRRLQDAMHYAVFPGGKRIRPLLVYATGETFGAPLTALHAAAVSVELIHCYSLVHDDLPVMDDDDLRRGQPTCHIAYDEATAILIGDALQTLAFNVLAQSTQLDGTSRVEMIQALSEAAGHNGMVAGQALDLEQEYIEADLQRLETMHRHKTGALINAAIQMGSIAAAAPSELRQNLSVVGYCAGLAFQIQDDILDLESSTATLGKPQGADQQQNKTTFPALMGLDGAKKHMRVCYQRALDTLQACPGQQPLYDVINSLIERQY